MDFREHICKNCYGPIYGLAPQINFGILEIDGNYCSKRCVNENVKKYFNGAVVEGCPPEIAKEIINGFNKKLQTFENIPEEPLANHLNSIMDKVLWN